MCRCLTLFCLCQKHVSLLFSQFLQHAFSLCSLTPSRSKGGQKTMHQQLLSKQTRPLRPSACAQVPRIVYKACRQARPPVTRPYHGAAAADRIRSVVVPAAAAALDAVPEDDDDGVDQEGVDADAYVEPPFDGGFLVHCCCCCHCCGCGCCCHPCPCLPHQPEHPLP